MIFKRSYEVSLVPCGHPLFNPNGQRCEIVVKDGEDRALIYKDICKSDDIEPFLEMLDGLSFGMLDEMTRFWGIKRAWAQGTLLYMDNEPYINEPDFWKKGEYDES